MTKPLAQVFADLHVHTVASACAEVEMIPPLIVRRAQYLGLNLIGITDHHSVENVEAVQQAARPYGISVLPGMEVQTREEVHVICLFDSLERARKWQEMIWSHLPQLSNREDFFGPQYIVDMSGDYVRTNERLLQTSTDLSFDQVMHLAEDWGGLPIPAHVDRPRNSMFANLGIMPRDVRIPGVEISSHITVEEAHRRFPSLQGMGLIQSGDAHRLEEMIATLRLTIEARTAHEVRLAILGQQGRGIELPGG